MPRRFAHRRTDGGLRQAGKSGASSALHVRELEAQRLPSRAAYGETVMTNASSRARAVREHVTSAGAPARAKRGNLAGLADGQRVGGRARRLASCPAAAARRRAAFPAFRRK